MAGLPAGTITFLFTDIEGSTALLQRLGDRQYADILTEHRRVLRAAFAEGGGIVIDARGEEFFVAFTSARDALVAAVSVQQAIGTYPWPEDLAVRVRMGLHTGEPIGTGDTYVGLDVHRAARICAAGHGGQILISQATYNLIRHELPIGLALRDLGEHRLKDLQRPERIYQLLHPDLPDVLTPLRSLSTLPNNLPVQLTGFIGREREMADLRRLLGTTRLLTLTGIGGAGKTRLALQVAAEVLDDYPDGAWLVELAALGDPALVPQTVAAALRLREEPGRSIVETLLDWLKPRALLLILDNCEHLIGACAQLAERLLQAAPHVRILATSRETLGLFGERTYPVPPLSVPDLGRRLRLDALARAESVRLFVERASFRQLNFRLTEANARAVAEICRTLDGIPLAIELAAARTAALPVEEIAARTGERFHLLRGGSRTAPPRQQTLEAMLDWSYDLLTERERTLFDRLSVFQGSFTLQAAEEICADGIAGRQVLDLLTQLVNKSLVLMDPTDDHLRYRMLETVRAYSRIRLRASGEEDEVRRRHRDWYLRWLEQLQPMPPEAEEEMLDRLEADHGNCRAALEYSIDRRDPEAALRLCAALGRFWLIRGYWTEGRERLAAALAIDAPVRPELRARALQASGTLAHYQGDYARAREFSEQSLALHRQVGDLHGMAGSLTTLGNIAYQQGDYAAARQLHEESLAYGRQAGDPGDMAVSMVNLAILAQHYGDYERAAELGQESLDLLRTLGNKRGIAFALHFLGVIEKDTGRYDRGQAYFEQSLALQRELGEKRGIASGLGNLGLIALHRRDYEAARSLLDESLALHQELGHRSGVALALSGLAMLEAAEGHLAPAIELCKESLRMRAALGDRAGIADSLEGVARLTPDPAQRVRLAAAAAVLREAINAPRPPAVQAALEDLIGAARQVLSQRAFAEAWQRGQSAPLDAMIDDALATEPSGVRE